VLTTIAIALIALGSGILVAALTYAVLYRPTTPIAPDNDTIAFIPEGPENGQVVRVEGRVVVADAWVCSPNGRRCALYEVYASDDGPARPVSRRAVHFLVDDGVHQVRVDPRRDLVAFDLPTAVVDAAEGVYIERVLPPGARVQVVGRVQRLGAPGHEEVSLIPPGDAGVALTFLGA
jgi:hypothetical protein